MSRRLRILAVPIVLASLAGSMGVARADDPRAPSAQAAAQEHYTQGRESYRQGLYGRALEEFERSLALAPSPNTRLYIARALRELGRLGDARLQLELTVREAEERGGKYAQTREAAENELRDIRVRIERSEASSASASASAPASAPAPASASASAPASAPASTEPAVRPTAVTWVSGGVTVAGLAAFGILYGLASDRYGYLEDHCRQVRDASCDDARGTGKTEEGAAFVALSIAGVAAAIAVVSLFVHPAASPNTAKGPWRIAF